MSTPGRIIRAVLCLFCIIAIVSPAGLRAAQEEPPHEAEQDDGPACDDPDVCDEGRPYTERVEVRPTRPVHPGSAFPTGLQQHEIRQMSGTLEDPLRALQSVPGVAAVTDFKSELRLRGGEPEDTIFWMDGVSFDNPYHFRGAKGSTAALNASAFDSIAVLTSGLGARLGDTVSGAIVLTPTERGATGTFLETGVGSLATWVTAGGPAPGGGSWVAAGRYSSLDLYVDKAGLPEFADLYVRGRLPAGPRLSVVAGVLTHQSDSESFDADDRLTTDLEADTLLGYVGLDANVRDGLRLTARASRNRFTQTVAQAGLEPLDAREERSVLRMELHAAPARRWRWNAGGELARLTGDVRGAFEDLGVLPSLTSRSSRWGLFASVELEPAAGWVLEAGIRGDRDSAIDSVALQPRLRAEYHGPRGWETKLSASRYAQFRRLEQAFLATGEEPGVSRSSELSAGLGFPAIRHVKVWITAFTRHLQDVTVELINRRPDIAEEMGRMRRARARGLELGVRRDRGRLQAALALSTVDVRGSRHGVRSVRNGDQPYLLDLSGLYLVTPGWQVGGRFRAASGLPYSALQRPVGGEWVARELNDDRLPATARLDLRSSWTRDWGSVQGRFYFEIQNVLARRNVRGRELEWDPAAQDLVISESDLTPFLPVIGLEMIWGATGR